MVFTKSALVAAFLLIAVTAAPAAPLFYVSPQPLGVAQPGMSTPDDWLSTGTVNIYAMPDVQLSGVSLDLLETGGGIEFTGLNVINDGRWWILDGPQTIEPSQISSIGGGAIPGIEGRGIGPDPAADSFFHPASGYLLATATYQVRDTSRPINFQLQVGNNAIADWYGNSPSVHFGSFSVPGVPGERPLTSPVAPPVIPAPLPPISEPDPPTVVPLQQPIETPPIASGSGQPLFYVSHEPLGAAQPGNSSPSDWLSSGTVNIYATTDVRLSGVSLDLLETGSGIKFTELDVLNEGRWSFLDGPQTIEPSKISSIGGAAIPGISGQGVGPGTLDDVNYDSTSGYLLATAKYEVLDPNLPINFQLQVGNNAIADWYGNSPFVHLGDASVPAVPGLPSPILPIEVTPPTVPPPVDPPAAPPAIDPVPVDPPVELPTETPVEPPSDEDSPITILPVERPYVFVPPITICDCAFNAEQFWIDSIDWRPLIDYQLLTTTEHVPTFTLGEFVATDDVSFASFSEDRTHLYLNPPDDSTNVFTGLHVVSASDVGALVLARSRPAPEPSTCLMAVTGLFGAVSLIRRRG